MQRQSETPERAAGLFHIPNYPAEQHDISAEHADDVARLTRMYEAWKKDFPETPLAPNRRADAP